MFYKIEETSTKLEKEIKKLCTQNFSNKKLTIFLIKNIKVKNMLNMAKSVN